MSRDTDTTLEIDGEQIDVTVEYDIDSYGSGGTAASLTYPGDPPEAPEFTVSKIYRIDNEVVTFEYDQLPDKVREKLDDHLIQCIGESMYDDEPDWPEPED
jgi:hypothetical protein